MAQNCPIKLLKQAVERSRGIMDYDGIRRWPQFRRDEFIVKHTINVQKCLVQFSCQKSINLHTSFWAENHVFYGVRCAYRDARPRHSVINSKAKSTARRGAAAEEEEARRRGGGGGETQSTKSNARTNLQ